MLELSQEELTKDPKPSDHLRIVCISDTHSKTSTMVHPVPPGDILVHAGDFSSRGYPDEVEEFNEWLSSLPHRQKIVVAGNHELTFDPLIRNAINKWEKCKLSPQEIICKLTSCIYLEDSSFTFDGVTFYGSPWQPEHGGMAFNKKRGEEIQSMWDKIPSGVDVLVTHAPPHGIGDLSKKGSHEGCLNLVQTVQSWVKPKFHIYGHIHEGYGIRTDGTTVFINASTCQDHRQPLNKPIVFDIKIPQRKL